ncbi:MAG: type II secretion system F family protein [Candidatus Omnitrophica bacterium]|nr:type II secretion system F family protein [Candidatus Omnitrophota bacterium]
MPNFFYIARDKFGNKIRKTEEAVSEEELIGRLQASGLTVISVIPQVKEERGFKPGAVPKVRFIRKHYRIKYEDLTLFCRQLSTLLTAGVTIIKSLEIISQQVASQKLYNVIKDLQKNMETGLSLHEAMAKHPNVFSDLWINLVDSGEASGNIAGVLDRLASYLERMASFKAKIISSLVYPAILIGTAILALLFITMKIIPTFAQIFEGFNVKLPLLTLFLIKVSKFINRYILLIVVLISVLFYLFRAYKASKEGRFRYEKIILSLPILGKLYRTLILERFTSEMATLTESGVPLLYSLEIAERSVGSVVVGEIIRKVKENVREGESLSSSIERSGFFEPMFVQIVIIGEEIGELSNMLKKLNSYYQEWVDMFLIRLVGMFEPVLILFVGTIIGIMVIGLVLPIFKISQIRL